MESAIRPRSTEKCGHRRGEGGGKQLGGLKSTRRLEGVDRLACCSRGTCVAGLRYLRERGRDLQLRVDSVRRRQDDPRAFRFSPSPHCLRFFDTCSSSTASAQVTPTLLQDTQQLNMAARGGRGGGRGGRGGGASGKPQMPIGHLAYADIIAYSGEGTDVLYPVSSLPSCSARRGGLRASFPDLTCLALHSQQMCPTRSTLQRGKRGSLLATTL